MAAEGCGIVLRAVSDVKGYGCGAKDCACQCKATGGQWRHQCYIIVIMHQVIKLYVDSFVIIIVLAEAEDIVFGNPIYRQMEYSNQSL